MVRFLYIGNSMVLTKRDYLALSKRVKRLVADIASNFEEPLDITTIGDAWADYIPTALVLSKDVNINKINYVFKVPLQNADGKGVFVQGDVPGYAASDYNIAHSRFAGAIAVKQVEGRMSKDKRKAKIKALTISAASSTRTKLHELSTRLSSDSLEITTRIGTVNIDDFDRVIVVDQMNQTTYHTDTVDDDAATLIRDSDTAEMLKDYKGIIYKINIDNSTITEEEAAAKTSFTIEDTFKYLPGHKRKSNVLK